MIKIVNKRGKRVLVELDYDDFLNLHCLAMAAQKIYEEQASNMSLDDDDRQKAEECCKTAALIRSIVTRDFLSNPLTNI